MNAGQKCASAKQKPIVLIVDDEPKNIQILSALLGNDYDLRAARTGEKCLEIAQGNEKPDLILLDINMPGMDGYEVCRRLKADDATRSIAVIFITGRTGAEDEEKGFSLGAVDYIVKPFRPIVIAARVRNHVNLKLHSDDLERNASTDGLTGLENRRSYDEQLQKLWNHCLREHQSFSIAMIDIDYFKLYNDFYGHGAGDVCLRLAAQAIKENCMRSLDLAARYGGEEFAVIFPNTDEDAAFRLADDIRQAVYNLQMMHEKSPSFPYVTISVGVASALPSPSVTPESVAKKADEALYRAKQNGRNRCEK